MRGNTEPMDGLQRGTGTGAVRGDCRVFFRRSREYGRQNGGEPALVSRDGPRAGSWMFNGNAQKKVPRGLSGDQPAGIATARAESAQKPQ